VSDPNHRSSKYPLSTMSAPIKPTDITRHKAETLKVTNHYVKKEYDRLYEQAEVLMKQFNDLDRRVKITTMIESVRRKFKPVPGNTYWLYMRDRGDLFLSLIGKDDWAAGIPGQYVAQVERLGDSTWEVIDTHEDFKSFWEKIKGDE